MELHLMCIFDELKQKVTLKQKTPNFKIRCFLYVEIHRLATDYTAVFIKKHVVFILYINKCF